jgi:hypothetical protein
LPIVDWLRARFGPDAEALAQRSGRIFACDKA